MLLRVLDNKQFFRHIVYQSSQRIKILSYNLKRFVRIICNMFTENIFGKLRFCFPFGNVFHLKDGLSQVSGSGRQSPGFSLNTLTHCFQLWEGTGTIRVTDLST